VTAHAARLAARSALAESARVGTRVPAYLAFTRYCYAQYCMVYGIKTGDRRGVEYRAIAL